MTKHQIDPRLFTESDLTRHLLAARGTQWMRGNRGDPYALILRAQGIDPHVLYRGMRGRPALRQSESDVWVTADHATGAEVLADPRLGPADARARRRRVFGLDSRTTLKHVLAVDDSLLGMDRAALSRLTEFAAPALGPGAVEEHREAVREVCAETLGGIDGDFDLMTDYARACVTEVYARLLALPAERRPELAELCSGAGLALDAQLCPPTLEMTHRLIASYDGLRHLLAGLVTSRAEGADPTSGPDVVRGLLRGAGPGTPHADPAESTTAALLLTVVIGVEVTAQLVCGAMLALLEQPDEWESLRANPELAAGAVEETLRHSPPVRLESRIAGEAMSVAGQPVGKGDQIVVLVDAANRDPEVFSEPDRFRITRRPAAPHLSLTSGSYSGFAAPLVRMVAQEALRTLAGQGPARLRTDAEVIRRIRSPVLGGVARYPVAVAQEVTEKGSE
ncbi:cytochrome P450 family protein [Streptomyces tendae]|uniref:cytochrome P450 family protein n=1 Tax=Streptomyces tendae TaxID=1932 RepID=UPI00371B4BEF